MTVVEIIYERFTLRCASKQKTGFNTRASTSCHGTKTIGPIEKQFYYSPLNFR